jgi:hypothetical protein
MQGSSDGRYLQSLGEEGEKQEEPVTIAKDRSLRMVPRLPRLLC